MNTQTEFPISVAPGEQRGMRIDGNYVVWSDESQGVVMGYDLISKTDFVIGSGFGPDISGDIVVFIRDWDIYGYNLLTAEEFIISSHEYLQRDPRISGNIVTWNDYRTGIKSVYGAEIVPEPCSLLLIGFGGLFLRKRN